MKVCIVVTEKTFALDVELAQDILIKGTEILIKKERFIAVTINNKIYLQISVNLGAPGLPFVFLCSWDC